jgi:hypothetical protein
VAAGQPSQSPTIPDEPATAANKVNPVTTAKIRFFNFITNDLLSES